MKIPYLNKFLFSLVILFLAFTNPSYKEHQNAVIEKVEEITRKRLTSQNDKWEDFGLQLGMLLGKKVITNSVTRENFVLFSITKANFLNENKIIGFGFAGSVIIFNIQPSPNNQNFNPDIFYDFVKIIFICIILLFLIDLTIIQKIQKKA